MAISKRNAIQTAKDYTVIMISAFLYAFTFNFFFEANQLAMGGFTGIGQILHRFFPYLTPGVVVLALNLPLMVIGAKKQGRKLLLGTIFAICVTSVLIDGMNLVVTRLGWSYPKMEQPLLACLFGGILCGASLGLMMLRNATTGGTELAARLLKYIFKSISIGKLCLAIDVTVVCAYAMAYRQLESALYGIVAMYAASLSMDMVVYGAVNAKIAYIISDRSVAITELLMDMELGATILSGKGAFTGTDKSVIMCAVKPSKISRIKTAVIAVDPNAFIVVTDAKEVYGEGFGIYNEDTL